MRKAAILIAFFVAYLVLLSGINVLHFRYVTVNVVFYAALADVIVACSIVWGLAAIAQLVSGSKETTGGSIRLFSGTEIALSAVVAVLAGYILAISVPTVIDRSFSIYILEKLEQRGGAISLEAMTGITIKEFIQEHRLIDARMTEQLNSGTLTIDSGCVILTDWGKRVVAFTRYYRSHLLPKRRVLMGDVTSDLTDPFRNPTPVVDYRCHGGVPPGKVDGD